jgi:glycosyltransferase involved in cell wall biosynthesis
MNDLVSIVIPAYNSAEFIPETLEACLAQSYSPIEIVVVDDGSSDDTLAIVRSYESLRVIQQDNSGPAIARNTGVQAAKGEYIQFCDSDDILHPEKIARCLAILRENPDAALAYCRMQAIDTQGNILSDAATSPPEHFFETNELFCKILNTNGSPIQTSTVLARKMALLDVGVYRADPNYRCSEDWDLLLRLADQYPFVGIDETLVSYRHRPDALTHETLLMAEGRLRTVIYARDYSKRKQCMSDRDYDVLEAGRYHVLAMTQWAEGNRKAAREAFLQAAKLTKNGASLRRIYALLSYIFPASLTEQIDRVLKKF